MNTNRLALIAVLLIPSIAAPEAGAQTRQQRVDQAARVKSDPAADAAAAATEAQAAADAAAAAGETEDAAAAAFAAAEAAEAAIAEAIAADPYQNGGYQSLARAVEIYKSRGSRTSERWLRLLQGSDGTWWSIDLRTISAEGSTRTLWNSTSLKSGGSRRARDKFNCTTGTYQTVQIIEYDADGETDGGVPVTAPPRLPAPDTLAEGILEWACAR